MGPHERRFTNRLLSLWQDARHGKPLPRLADVEAGADRALQDRSFVIDVSPGPSGYRFTRFGAALRQVAGVDFSGYSIDALPENIAHDALDICHTAIASSKPVLREKEFARIFGHPVCYRMIVLPVSKQRKRVGALIGTVGYRVRREDELREAGGLETTH